MNSLDDQYPFSRLIVLLPESVAGNLEFAARIHWIAMREQKSVLYFTLLDDPDNSLRVSRQLTTMKALTSSESLRAGSIQVADDRWLDKLREILGPSDKLVCHEEQLVQAGLFKTTPMSDFLTQHFLNPLIIERGYYNPEIVLAANWLNKLVFWAGIIAILGGFTYLEIQTGALIPGFISKLVLIIFISLEFGAVWVWNQLLRR